MVAEKPVATSNARLITALLGLAGGLAGMLGPLLGGSLRERFGGPAALGLALGWPSWH